jgi:hypothetical protein
MPTLIPAAMVAADVATQAELEVIQVVGNQTGAVATGTATIPLDDTIPQITEGTEFLTQAITPTLASSILQVDVTIVVNSNFAGSVSVIAALFRDAGASALAAVPAVSGTSLGYTTISFRHRVAAGSTAATTFRVRVGSGSASTVTINGSGGARQLGGAMASSITVTELAT